MNDKIVKEVESAGEKHDVTLPSLKVRFLYRLPSPLLS